MFLDINVYLFYFGGFTMCWRARLAFTVLCVASASVHAGISPSKTEINLASFPVDQYSSSVLNNGIFPNCPADVSVRDCVKRWFNNNPSFGTVYSGNYVSQ